MANILECLDVDAETLKGLKLVIDAFTATIPSIINPLEFGPKIPELPGSAIELFLDNLSPEIPSFSANILGVDISFKGKDLNQGVDFPFPVFDPKGLVQLITGLVGVLVNMPELFIDVDLLIPKVPTRQDVILLIAAQIGLIPNPLSLPAEYIEKFVGCLVETVAVFIP